MTDAQKQQFEFGEALRARRRELGLTQEQLSFESSVSFRQIQDLEACKNLPGLLTIFKLAKALQTTPDVLLMEAWESWLEQSKI